MYSTSVYGLEFLVLEKTVGRALATDHRENSIKKQIQEFRQVS